jgi:hypothetical protein
LNKKNVGTLAQELDLNAQERADVAAIQTTEELAAYFEKIPRDYDVQLVISDTKPGCMFDRLWIYGKGVHVVTIHPLEHFTDQNAAHCLC